ncbi:MAG: hypothetical protein ABJN57_09455 [Hyphomicrobiales bacterium]
MSKKKIVQEEENESVIEGNGEEIRKGPHQWIDFLRHHLADIYVRSEADYSPYRFVNRVSFMSLKHPIIILFHEKQGEDNPDKFEITVDELMSAYDPAYIETFHEQLKAYGDFYLKKDKDGIERRHFKLTDKNIKKCLINLFGTTVHILLFELTIDRIKHNDKIVPSAEPKLIFKPLHPKLDRWKFYKYLFEPFDGQGPRTKLPFKLVEHYRELKNIKVHKATEDNPTRFQPFETDIIEACLKEVGEMIDEEYLYLCKSPMMRSFVQAKERNHTGPCNIFFVGKIFNRQTSRFKNNYKYDPYFFMGRQSEDIKRQLLKMGGHKIPAKDLVIDKIKVEELETLSRDDFIPYSNAFYDEAFWRGLGNKRHIDEMIERLNNPWPDHIRLSFENNLLSGAKTILRNVFEECGLGWIDNTGLSENEENAAHMRLVELHYILQLCSPVNPREAENLTIVVDSIRVNGAVWMSACYLRENIGDDPVKGLLDQKRYDEGILITHSLIRQTVRRLRNKAASRYLKSISQIIKDIAYRKEVKKGPNVVPMTNQRGLHFMDNSILQDINKYTRSACRVYPYDHITLETIKKSGQTTPNSLKFEFKVSPFYDRLSPKSYMNYHEIVEQLFDQLQLRALEKNGSDKS